MQTAYDDELMELSPAARSWEARYKKESTVLSSTLWLSPRSS